MTAEADINDAIDQLEMLGIDKKKAIKALNRYNYNVERAADYVFSGNADSEDDGSTNGTDGPGTTTNNSNNNSTDWPWAEPSSFDNVSTTGTATEQSQPQQPIALTHSEAEKTPVYLIKNHGKNSQTADSPQDSSSWSVVPFTNNSSPAPTLSKPERAPVTQSSLTWWNDPTSPSARAAIADIPAGLRPPSYNFAYSPIVIQALFHVPLFRHAVLSFRPTPQAWGAPQNYWKGFGEPVPGYIRSTHTPPPNSSAPSIPNLMDAPINNGGNETPDETLDDTIDETLDENVQNDLVYTHYSTPPEEEALVPMTKDQLALAELQKLFAFLGHTNRLYGSVAHYMRAINTRPVTSSSTGWQVDDKSMEDFLDSVIGGLVAAESTNEQKRLEKLFFLRAEIDNGMEVEIEDIYYLNLGINTGMSSFHDCLDPLVYESYAATDNDDDDLGSNVSDDEATYKLTTFTQVPPILLVTLENRRDYAAMTRTRKDSTFTVDKVIYMDRYLNENKAVVLDKYRQADQWKQDIRQTQAALDKEETHPCDTSSSTLSSHQLLQATTKYLDSKVNGLEWTNENEPTIKSMRSLQQVLYQVCDDLENKKTELQNLIRERQDSLQTLFNEPGLRQRPYDLRAVLHTDGLSGTGHYWGYIWVDAIEVNLLADIPSPGGWYRFCDAKVEKVVDEEDVWRDIDPFALVYTDRSAPTFSKQQLDEITPADLMQFVQVDNATFANEIKDELNDGDDDGLRRPKSQLSTEADDGSIDGGVRVPSPSGDFTANDDNEVTSLVGSNAMDLAALSMKEIKGCGGDDYRLMKRFDTFLARAGYIHTLACYYRLVESGTMCLVDDGDDDDDAPPNYDDEPDKLNDTLDTLTMDDIRTIVRDDKTLFLLFELYEQYLTMGQTLATALTLFVDNNIMQALDHLVKSSQQHDSWHTHLMLNESLLWNYHGLSDLGFDSIALKYGMACIKELNGEAYTKACDDVSRTKGLIDGIRVANQAQWVVRRQRDTDAPGFLSDLANRWLTFTEMVSGSLTDEQGDFLNTLVMIYLDGPTSSSTTTNDDASLFSMDRDDSMSLDGDDEPVWIAYRQALWDAESKLSD